MNIKLVWVGKTKEKFIIEGIKKYIDLLRPYAEITISEIKEEKVKNIQKMLDMEGEKILKNQTPYILLDENGEAFDSVKFASLIENLKPSVTFVLGGAYGVSDRVKALARRKISLSKMTFTHEMSRLILLEQLYRAFTIIHKRGYHH